jgi:Kdo2-lipid IVA lauroyltransferase/acyltransferase
VIEPADVPKFRALFGDAEGRRAARQYWLKDTVAGLLELALYRLLRLTPVDFCSWFGGAIVHLTRHFYPGSERRARKLWMALRPQEADPAAIDAAMNRLWQCVSRTMTEFAVLDRLWANNRIVVEGEEHVVRARAEGRPILLAAVHLGNWEVIPAAGYALGYVGSSIYEPPPNRFEHHIAVEVRARLGAKSIAAGPTAARAVLRALKEWKGPFVIFVDELTRDRVQAPAFGRPLPTDGNIAYIVRLAAMCDAVVIPVYCLRIGGHARFKVTALPPLELARGGDRHADMMESVMRLNAILEAVIKANLDQWFYALDFDFAV